MSRTDPTPRTLCAAALVLLLSCAKRPVDETADESASTSGTTSTASTGTSTSMTPTTGDDAQTSGTGPDPSTGSPLTTGSDGGDSGSSSGTGGDLPDAEDGCDVWAQDCPEGQKCMPVGPGEPPGVEAQCVPVVADPDLLDEPCQVLGDGGDGLDTCAEGQLCYRVDLAVMSGICIALCGGSENAPTCPEPALACELDDLGVANLCFRHCDPLAQDCPEVNVCVPRPSPDVQFICVQDDSGDGGQVFDPCTRINTCDPGLFCGYSEMIPECDGGSEGCCTAFCDVTADPDPCPGQGQTCLAWYDEAPPGLEDVGACGVPPI